MPGWRPVGAVPLAWGERMVAVGSVLKVTSTRRTFGIASRLVDRLSVAVTVIEALFAEAVKASA
jgi:hypothetical protein